MSDVLASLLDRMSLTQSIPHPGFLLLLPTIIVQPACLVPWYGEAPRESLLQLFRLKLLALIVKCDPFGRADREIYALMG